MEIWLQIALDLEHLIKDGTKKSMTSYAHKQILKQLTELSKIPSEKSSAEEFLKAEKLLELVQNNSLESEIILFANLENIYIHSIAIPESSLYKIRNGELFGANITPYRSAASYSTTVGSGKIKAEIGHSSSYIDALTKAKDLYFVRDFVGWSGKDGSYIELSQELSHLADVHWRSEYNSYCRFSSRTGDLENVFSITNNRSEETYAKILSCDRNEIDEYLAISKMRLIRFFDFTITMPQQFYGWTGKETTYLKETQLYYRQLIQSNGSYTCGYQIMPLLKPPEEIIKLKLDKWFGKSPRNYEEFIIYDFRNKIVRTVSTEPSQTTNYFDAKKNDLPFELSPAFFRPEVLLKYKTDKEKYSVEDRSVSCRNSWSLRGYDVNEAGQVHAYICDLRKLPYEEQLHWKSYNEQPKTTISERALKNDFLGQWTKGTHSLNSVIKQISDWKMSKFALWKISDEKLINQVSRPLSESLDEWADAFMDLSKLIVEGFNEKKITAILNEKSIPFAHNDRTISLLEKLILKEERKFVALREVQKIRSKIKGHISGSEAEVIKQKAIEEFGSYREHYEYWVGQLYLELCEIDKFVKNNGI